MRNTGPYRAIDAGDAAGNITGSATNINQISDVAYSCIFTGSPVGTVSVQGSIDGTNYVTIESRSITAAGVVLFDLPSLSFNWIRLVYTFASGSGALTAWCFGKGRD